MVMVRAFLAAPTITIAIAIAVMTVMALSSSTTTTMPVESVSVTSSATITEANADADQEVDEQIPHLQIKNWALKFGVNLWAFSYQLTNAKEIRSRYEENEVDIRRKDLLKMVREVAAEMKNYLLAKKNALVRIVDKAELAWMDSNGNASMRAQPSLRCDHMRQMAYEYDEATASNLRQIKLARNPRFHPQRLVDDSKACTLPLGSDFESKEDTWLDALNKVFVSNYEHDPSLFWQYFAMSNGIIARYPALMPEGYEDTFVKEDFRATAEWYIGATTSAKDVVILLDVSASHSRLALATLSAIFDTTTDNDFVNVQYASSDGPQPQPEVELHPDAGTSSHLPSETSSTMPVPATTLQPAVGPTPAPCNYTSSRLIQATSNNKHLLLRAAKRNLMLPPKNRNLTATLIASFDILRRTSKSGAGAQCNQAIMIISDQSSPKQEHVFSEFNWPHKPVRIFTYLISPSESANNAAADIKWMACENRGFYERITSLDGIGQKVTNYLKVMARPLVMYGNNHAVYWSAARLSPAINTESACSQNHDQSPVVTISAPAYDKMDYSDGSPRVLGVAAIDISIAELKKLVPAYRLGPNGYSFIVNNNGHVIYHPNLRIHNSKCAHRARSVDLSEVENIDLKPEMVNTFVLDDMRRAMIDQYEREAEYHLIRNYDYTKRVSNQVYQYIYTPIYDTEFSVAIAIPKEYGSYELFAEEEIKRSETNVTDYFRGGNWKVHPDWVYCEYYFADERIFRSAEERVLHFLTRSVSRAWKWMSIRPRHNEYEYESEPANGGHRRRSHAYYCDKYLTQALVYDAKLTLDFDKPASLMPRISKHDKHQGNHHFGEIMTFVATRSGLLRWVDQSNLLSKRKPLSHFSENNARAQDEVWYKRAVEHHSIEPESFVYAVDTVTADDGKEMSVITATHAIFLRNKARHSTPIAVVGIQFQYEAIAAHFLNVTSTCARKVCNATCASEELDCFVLDDHGFIVVSEKSQHAGQFFGQTDGTIMDSLVQDGIYERISTMDTQALCNDVDAEFVSDSAARPASFNLFSRFGFGSWLLSQISLWAALLGSPFISSPTTVRSHREDVTAADVDDYEMTDERASNAIHGDPSSPNDTIAEPDFRDWFGKVATVASLPPIYVPAPNYTGLPDAFETDDSSAAPRPIWTEQPQPQPQPRPPKTTVGNADEHSANSPCRKMIHLYTLRPIAVVHPIKGKLTNCDTTGCERRFVVQKIAHSNLILVVVTTDADCPCHSKKISIVPEDVPDEPPICVAGQVPSHPELHRRRLPRCVSYHPEESETAVCSSSWQLTATVKGTLAYLSLYILSSNLRSLS